MSSSESTASGQPFRDQQDLADRDDLPEIYRGGASGPPVGDGERPDTVITTVHGSNVPSWSRRRAIITGAIVGAFFGSVFFAGYAGTSVWICSARLDCGHWAPITITAVAGAIGSSAGGAIGGYVLHKMYRLFKVA